MRKLKEKVVATPNSIMFVLESDDGLSYTEEVSIKVDDHKQFSKNMESARQKIVSKRIWLNARKALTKEEIEKL